MTDQERILRLLQDGKITREQAEELLEALDEADSASFVTEGNLALEQQSLSRDLEKLATIDDKVLRKLERIAYLKDSGIAALEGKSAKELATVDEALLRKLERIAYVKEQGLEITEEDLIELDRGRYGEIYSGTVTVNEETRKAWGMSPESIPAIPLTPPTPPMPPLPPIPPTKNKANDLPKDLTWINVKAISGDVNIQVDAGLSKPVVEGDDGPLPVYMPENSNGKDKLSIESLDEDLDITLPENYGVILEVKSGDVSIEDCFVAGKVLSGDVSLENIKGLQLTVMSGDVDGNFQLRDGTHSLEVASGDVSLIFQEGSSLTFQGNVQAGDTTIRHSKGDLNHENMSFEGTVGSGDADFLIVVQSGDLNIDIEAESSSVTTKGSATKKSKSDKNFEFNFEFDFSFANKLKEPKNLRWLAIRSLSGNVRLRTEPGLAEPKVLEGKQLKQKDNGEYGMYSLMGNIEVLLPDDYGVRCDVMSGNLEAHDVAYVRGRVWAGNAELNKVHGVNMVVMSGNAEAELLLSEAEHNLEVWAGNAEVELLKGSSVVAKATVPVGDVNAKTENVKYEPLEHKSFRATMGEGKAQLNLSVKVGNLDFEANNV
jgi:hypothetical protein